MIKFFRKIRQKMLTKNKFSKYLIYAIGEIVLVVIGILIALQVNQWNEVRKNKTSLYSYTTTLIEDLKRDTVVINQTIKFAENSNATIQRLSDRLSSPDTTTDTLMHIARHELVFDYKAYRPPNTSTLLAIQSNGIFKLYDEQTYNALTELQSFQKIVGSIVTGQNSAYGKQLENLVSKYSPSVDELIKGPLIDQAWENIDPVDLFRTVGNFLRTKKVMNTTGNLWRNRLLKLTEQVLSRLIDFQENEIK